MVAKKNSAFMKPVQLSDALSKVIGHGPMPRTDVVKKVWEYIKKNDLQDKKNKRMINPDAMLSTILGSKQINMFEMTKKISEHLKAI